MMEDGRRKMDDINSKSEMLNSKQYRISKCSKQSKICVNRYYNPSSFCFFCVFFCYGFYNLLLNSILCLYFRRWNFLKISVNQCESESNKIK